MTAELALTPAPPVCLRLLPIPALDPPYDDEREPAAPTTAGALVLAFPPVRDALPLRLAPPADPTALATLTKVALPDPGEWGTRFGQAVAEVLVGMRSAAQLSRFASLDVLHKLERWTGRLAGRPGAPSRRPEVASVHLSAPRRGVIEASVGVQVGPRRRALALRFEGRGGTWKCTALELG